MGVARPGGGCWSSGGRRAGLFEPAAGVGLVRAGLAGLVRAPWSLNMLTLGGASAAVLRVRLPGPSFCCVAGSAGGLACAPQQRRLHVRQLPRENESDASTLVGRQPLRGQ